METKVSTYGIILEIYREYRNELATPLKRAVIKTCSGIGKLQSFLACKTHKSIDMLMEKEDGLSNRLKREISEVYTNLSFKTTFKDYRDFLFEANFMPTYYRRHPLIEEESCFSEDRIYHFGTKLGVLTEIAIFATAWIYAVIPQGEKKPVFGYVALKVVTNAASGLYEKFQKTKHRLEQQKYQNILK